MQQQEIPRCLFWLVWFSFSLHRSLHQCSSSSSRLLLSLLLLLTLLSRAIVQVQLCIYLRMDSSFLTDDTYKEPLVDHSCAVCQPMEVRILKP
uniref:Uncharacterized protein n=1 Tax=Oryza brachyantha TaxID=4533 RepID=J3MV24_ORYBR